MNSRHGTADPSGDLRVRSHLLNQSRPATRRRLVLSSLAGLLLLAGCAHPKPSPMPGLLVNGSPTSGFGANRLEDPGLKEFIEQQLHQPTTEWPLRQWDLSTLSQAALYFDQAFQTARQRSNDLARELAAASGRPAGSIAEPVWLPPAPPSNPAGGSAPKAPAGLHFEASADSSRARRLSRKEYLARGSYLQAASIAWDLRAKLQLNLVACRAAERGESLLVEMQEDQTELVRLAESRETEHMISPSELTQLQIQLAQIRLALIQTRLTTMDLRERLAQTLNLPVSAVFPMKITYQFSMLPPGALDLPGLRFRALHRRLDLMQFRADLVEAEELMQIETVKHGVNPSLFTGCRWDRPNNRWAVASELPLPDSIRKHVKVARAEARRNAAAAQLLARQSAIIDQVERHATVYRVMADDLADIDDLVRAIRQLHDTLNERYQAGSADALELFVARVQLDAAALSQLQAEVRLQQALGALENALQRPLDRMALTNAVELPPVPPPPSRSDSVQQPELRDAPCPTRPQPNPPPPPVGSNGALALNTKRNTP